MLVPSTFFPHCHSYCCSCVVLLSLLLSQLLLLLSMRRIAFVMNVAGPLLFLLPTTVLPTISLSVSSWTSSLLCTFLTILNLFALPDSVELRISVRICACMFVPRMIYHKCTHLPYTRWMSFSPIVCAVLLFCILFCKFVAWSGHTSLWTLFKKSEWKTIIHCCCLMDSVQVFNKTTK